MEPILANAVNVLNLGRQGEHLRTPIIFDYSDLATEFPGGAAILIHRMPDATDGHAVAGIEYDFDLDHLIWTVSENELAKEGQGECQLIYSWEGRAKSKIWKTNVGRSLVATGSQPPSWKDYIDQMADIAAEAVANFERAYQAYKDAEAERIKAEGEVEKAKAEVEKAKEEAIRSKGFADDSEQSAEQAEKWKNESPTFWAQPDEPVGAKDNDLWWDTDDDLYGLLKNANVANNLTTMDEGYALDARQGKVLGDRLTYFRETNGYSKVLNNVDANTVTTNGLYYVRNATNTPDAYGYLAVQMSLEAETGKQVFTVTGNNNASTYIRTVYNNSWTDWKKVPFTINNLSSTSTVDALSANQGRELREALNYFSLPEGSARVVSGSLNDLDKTGFYYSTNWVASTTPNDSQYGYCVYIKSNYINQGYQLFFQLSQTKMWIRNNYNGTWSAWAKVVTEENLQFYEKSISLNGWAINVSNTFTFAELFPDAPNKNFSNYVVDWSVSNTYDDIYHCTSVNTPNLIAVNIRNSKIEIMPISTIVTTQNSLFRLKLIRYV